MIQNLVVFCGAGFSKVAGLPLMCEFSDRLRDSKFLGDLQPDYDAIHLKCDSMGAFIGGSARNLEQLASFLSMLEMTRPEFEFPGCKTKQTPKDAYKLLMKAVRELVCPLIQQREVLSYFHSLFELSKSSRLTFITTNYDILIECVCMALNLRCTPSLDVLNARQSTGHSLYEEQTAGSVELFKLHGSANWYVDKFQNLCVASDFWIQEINGEEGLWDTNLQLKAGTEAEALLVPPAAMKPILSTALSPQWMGASAAIAQADALWFLGYSFPETDSFIRFFLASALCTNARIRQVRVIDPSIDVCRRARNLFTLPSLKDVLQVIPAKWEYVEYEELLKGKSPGVVVDNRARNEIHEAQLEQELMRGLM